METTQKVTKRKPRKKILQLFSVVLLLISAYLFYTIFMEFNETMTLSNQLEIVQEELSAIQEQNRKLSSQVEKLENPDYVQNYARGNYMLSKQGENIYYLPAEVEPPDSTVHDSTTSVITESQQTTTQTNP